VKIGAHSWTKLISASWHQQGFIASSLITAVGDGHAPLRVSHKRPPRFLSGQETLL